ncbi:MAG: tetratricopeptide repeat protein [Cyanobacteriota bacterium]|nr:tetratricopeptide repeat protein [Cyanobacteriota bacterium]
MAVDHSALEDHAIRLIQQGEYQQAEAVYRQLIGAGTTNHIAYVNLAAICGMQGRFDEVIGLLSHALQLRPDCPETHGNLGIALKNEGNLEAAISTYRTALRLRPDYPETHYNLGIALKDTGDIKAALASYRKALQLQPDYAEAHFNLAQTLFLSGDYKAGWQEYEWRHKKPRQRSQLHARPSRPLWQGGQLEPHSSLLLVSEIGLGDTLLFMRYIPWLRDQGVDVQLCAQPKLHDLIRTSGIHPAPLTPAEADAISQGQWLPLLSLPGHLGVSPDNPIVRPPYIRPSDALVSAWRDRLASETRPIIGLCWQGNPDHETGSMKGRSLPLETFATIAEATDASLLSLQTGFGSEQLAACSFRDRFVSCQQTISDSWGFLDTAAIIANCDLVISSDTAIAHLAGGMGRPTWLLLKQVPEWRWGLQGEDSFWYPSMRLFRQRERGNWEEVLQRVAEALQDHVTVTAADRGAAGSNAEGSIATGPETTGTETAGTETAVDAPGATGGPPASQLIQAAISLGDLIDKITTLQIKRQHCRGAALRQLQSELAALEASLESADCAMDATVMPALKAVNIRRRQLETAIRAKERDQDFGDDFIRLARCLYQENDRRAAIKQHINDTGGRSPLPPWLDAIEGTTTGRPSAEG